MVWLDGRLVPAADAVVPVSDHGLTVGDGLFETMKVLSGVAFALTRHLRRLHCSAEGLGLALPPEDVLRSAVEATIAANGAGVGRVRLTVTGGPGPAGSLRDPGAAPTVLCVAGPVAQWSPTASVVVVPWTRNERGALAGLKTTSYAENVIALQRALAAGADEAIFANTAGALCEGTGSNVFVVVEGRLVTPPLASGCLAGITRELVLEGNEAEERDVPVGLLAAAEEAFLTSTTRDVQPIGFVDGQPLAAAPGPVTAAAARAFAELQARTLDP